MTRHRRYLVAVLTAAMLAACAGKEDPAKLIASGKAFAERGDHAAAIIQLKNAIQSAPNSAEARFLLAQSLGETGNLPGALVELRKARDNGYDREIVDRRIARTMADMGDAAGLVKEAGELRAESAEGRAELRALLGEAQVGMGENKRAEALFAEALQIVPGYPQAVTGQARLAAMRGDIGAARKILDEVLARAPDTQSARLLRADVAKAQGQLPVSLADLEHVVKLSGRHIGGRFSLAVTQFELGNIEATEAQLAEMRKLATGDPRTAFVHAMVAYRKQRIEEANDAMQQVLKDMPNYVPALVLGGMIAAQRGELVQAESNLARAIEAQAGHLGARRALATVYLQTGRPKQAQTVLAPALQRAPQDPELLATQADVLAAQGDTNRAVQILEQLATAEPKRVDARVRLGELRAREGKYEASIAEFDRAIAANPDATRALFSKARVQMGRGALDDALKTLAQLETKEPKNPTTFELKGQAQLAKKDLDGARASFERAVAVQPNQFTAHNRLAALDIAAGKPEAARKRFEDLAKNDPKNSTPLLALAQVLMSSGAAPEQVTETLDRAVKADPQAAQARIALVGWLMRLNDVKRAMIVAQEGVTAFPANRALPQLLASAQIASGDVQQAIAGLQKLIADGVEVDPEALLQLARAHTQARNPNAAVSALRKAVDARPEAINLRRELALAYVAAGETQRALDEAKRIKALRNGAAAGALVEGDVFAAQRKWTEAVGSYRQSFAAERTGLAVTRMHAALNAAGKRDEAISTVDGWRRERPKDELVPMYLAEQALAARDFPAAIRILQPLVEQSPNNAIYLNNLAYAMVNVGEARSVEVAERAWKAEPYNAAVMDTYGWALTRHGDAKRGVALLESAVRIAPAVSEIRLHLAEALVKANRKDDARRELDQLAKGKDGSVRQAAETMLRGL